MNNPAASDPIRQAADHLRAGRRDAARAVLVEHVRLHPGSDQAWVLLSLTLDNPAQKKDCLQRALRINPNNAQARDELARLEPKAPAPKPAAPPPFASPPAEPKAPAPKPAAPPPFASPPAEPKAPAPKAPTPPPFVATPSIEQPIEQPAETKRSARPTPAPQAHPPRPAVFVEPPTGPDPAAASAAGGGFPWLIVLAVVGSLLIVALASIAVIVILQPAPTATPVRVVLQATQAAFPTLPPTWTASPPPSLTPIPPTRTPVPSATLRPPNATVSAEMDVIQLQVAELRGLAILSSVPRFLLSPERLEKSLEALLLTEADRARLVDDARVLTALGLIKPTYDLARYAINHQVDNIGGFYIPRAREIYVIGGRFSGIERWVYSHEFGHALVDQHFDIGAVGVYPDCRIGQQQCDAVRALVEGDATLLMEQWWLQYASPRDYQDILNYRPPAQTLPEQFPPPFVVADASFPYDYGYEFVRQLHVRGNWAAVNSAYASLPQTTEQIMHPEKYTAGEGPVNVTAPPVGQALGAGWRELANDSLGEWDTFLLLGYAADLEAQINLFAASEAAAGWGGDNYQVHYHDTLSQTVLAVHWVWDTSADAREFNTAFDLYLDRLFRGAKADGRAACWQASGQAACYFTAGRATLWLAGPDLATVDGLLGLYPDFQ